MRRFGLVLSLVALCVAGGVTAIPAAMAGPAGVAGSLTLQPTSGGPFTKVTAQLALPGAANTAIVFTYDNGKVGKCTTDGGGNCTVTFSVPNHQPAATYMVQASQVGGGPLIDATFDQNQGALILIHRSGPPGLHDTIHNYGFHVHDGLTITYAQTVVCDPTVCITDKNGHLMHNFVIPMGYPKGTYQILVVDSHGITATIAFRQTS